MSAPVHAGSLLEAAEALAPETVALRRAIHAEPELGTDLPATQAKVLEALASLPVEVRTGDRISSVVADLAGGGGDGPTILLRGDMDALPMPEDTGLDYASRHDGRMHACGHDGHTAMLASAARLLCDRRAGLPGRVRFMFQPGEEGDGGAEIMIAEGVLDGVDGAFAIHVSPNVPTGRLVTRGGPLLASADTFTAHITGKGGHASTPHFAIDPIPVAAEILLAWQTHVARRINVMDPAIVSCTKIEAGTTTNVIPEQARMTGTIRAVSEATRAAVHAALPRVAEGIAAAHDCHASVRIDDTGYPVTVNDDDFAAFVLATVATELGPDRAGEMPYPTMGAEDFSYVLQQVPGAMAFLGVCPDGVRAREAPSCHSNRMILNESALPVGVATYAAVAEAFLRR
jgi:amidohydrolase